MEFVHGVDETNGSGWLQPWGAQLAESSAAAAAPRAFCHARRPGSAAAAAALKPVRLPGLYCPPHTRPSTRLSTRPSHLDTKSCLRRSRKALGMVRPAASSVTTTKSGEKQQWRARGGGWLGTARAAGWCGGRRAARPAPARREARGEPASSAPAAAGPYRVQIRCVIALRNTALHNTALHNTALHITATQHSL